MSTRGLAPLLFLALLGGGCAEVDEPPARSAADLWLAEPQAQAAHESQPLPSQNGEVRPRLRETRVLGQSTAFGPAPQAAPAGAAECDEVYDAAPAPAAPAAYGATGYYPYSYPATPYYHRATPPAQGGRAAGSAPPVGGDWPRVPSYGPAAMGDRSRR